MFLGGWFLVRHVSINVLWWLAFAIEISIPFSFVLSCRSSSCCSVSVGDSGLTVGARFWIISFVLSTVVLRILSKLICRAVGVGGSISMLFGTVSVSVSVWLSWLACGSELNSRLSPDLSVEPVGESVVCMIGLFVTVHCGKGWVSGPEIVFLNLLLDLCLVMTGEVRWFLANIFLWFGLQVTVHSYLNTCFELCCGPLLKANLQTLIFLIVTIRYTIIHHCASLEFDKHHYSTIVTKV